MNYTLFIDESGNMSKNNGEKYFSIGGYLINSGDDKHKYKMIKIIKNINKNREKYFKYMDNNNCRRVYNSIIMNRKAIKRSKYHYVYILRQNLYMKYIWNKIKRNTTIKKILIKVSLS